MTTGLGSGVANSARRAPGFGPDIRVDLDAVGDHHRGRALATEELAQAPPSARFWRVLQVF